MIYLILIAVIVGCFWYARKNASGLAAALGMLALMVLLVVGVEDFNTNYVKSTAREYVATHYNASVDKVTVDNMVCIASTKYFCSAWELTARFEKFGDPKRVDMRIDSSGNVRVIGGEGLTSPPRPIL